MSRRQLPEIAAMGFDIVYLPPIHPIGRSFRKGPNNTTYAPPDAPGSPWAIGDRAAVANRALGAQAAGDLGGHKSIHPQLGTFADFDNLIAAARSQGVEIALDIAFQCSPDHPWVTEHPDWFVTRPDGSIQYAENPPKKYQDIYPLNFESPDWRGLWDELYSVFEFWIQRGVRVFRVDNPHTKALPFWEWCLSSFASELSRHDFSRRSIHAAARDVRLGQAGLHAIVHVLYMAQLEVRVAKLPGRAYAAAGQRILPAEFLAEYAGHTAQNAAGRRAPGVYASPDSCRDAVFELWHLWPCI